MEIRPLIDNFLNYITSARSISFSFECFPENLFSCFRVDHMVFLCRLTFPFQDLSSIPRNPLIADVCFKAGYIDSWGRATRKITEACAGVGFPEPLIEDTEGGIRVTLFSKFTPEVTPEVRRLISNLHREMSRQELQSVMGLKDDEHFRKSYLVPSIEIGVIEMTIPDKPQSSRQQYRLTSKGRKLQREL